MKKSEFVREIATKTNVSQTNVKMILGAMQEVIYEHIGENEKEGIPVIDGLKLIVADKAARHMRNPQTGEMMFVPAKKVPKAKFGKALKDVVSGVN